jgi:predicted nucleic-acid-binding Zn-ribbon protein
MKCIKCDYTGLIDQHCPKCGIDIYSDEYEKMAAE